MESVSKMNPKILILKARGQHLKNRNFAESENFKRAFAALNIESDIWGPGYDSYLTPFSEMAKNFDVFFVLENYEEGNWIPDISSYKQLKLHWAIDCHCGGIPRFIDFYKKSKLDIHLNSAQQYIPYFSGTCRKAYWFPNALADDIIYPKSDVEKKYDLGFCGSMIADRPTWTKILEDKYKSRFKKDIFVIGDDMVTALNSYKISINKSIADDLNFRVFESIGCKALLITNEVANIEKIVHNGKHCVTYKTIDEMLKTIDYYVEHPDEATEIAKNGYEHVKKNHTYLERAKLLLQIIKIG